MPLMKSIDGRLCNVPDEDAAQYLIPADKVAETLKAAGVGAPAGAGQAAQQPGQVQAYHWGHHYHNWGGWGGPFVAPYNNYYNYQNYMNHYGW